MDSYSALHPSSYHAMIGLTHIGMTLLVGVGPVFSAYRVFFCYIPPNGSPGRFMWYGVVSKVSLDRLIIVNWKLTHFQKVGFSIVLEAVVTCREGGRY